MRLVGGAQSAYVQELSYFFLNLLDEVVRTNGAVIRGREIADFERLSRLSREEALAIYYKYRPAIDKQTREVLKTALKKTDDALVGQFVRAMGSRRHMTNLATIIAAQTAQGMNEVLERQNIALAKDQATLWYDVTAEAIARHQAGEPTRAVMERGVTRLANSGLETIDYISGTKTTIDAALRRHIVSQANQARNRLLMQRMDEWEWDLVFVDAHFGARPSHAEWQGKVYSRSGNSTEYPSLVDVTGYGTVTGLCGASCYHYMTPYVPGYSELPDMDYSEQERITGMTSDEYYAATQKQRRYERLIRSQKREISYLQEVRADAVKQRIRLGELQDKLRQFTHDNHLRRDYERERAWAVSKQPRALKAPQTYTASAITTGSEFASNSWSFTREYGAILDKDGNVIGDIITGKETSITLSLPKGYKWEDLQVTHTHPYEYGGTFSTGENGQGDIYHLTHANLISHTAICHEGTYHIERTENSKPMEFYKAARAAEIKADTDAFDIVYDWAEKEGKTPFNGFPQSELDEMHRKKKAELMHEWFLENAKIYGYTYSFTAAGE
ncbi:phage minor capsid protein [Lancefieldella parvula]|uniref:phage minor capsid protein n=1 Tax=Lancefieldella parvula TaxID=1382 RepID=UPI00292E7F80|nr:phage minor capsid protein [Lancefieldella parvula]